jgi:hypothetical protein
MARALRQIQELNPKPWGLFANDEFMCKRRARSGCKNARSGFLTR